MARRKVKITKKIIALIVTASIIFLLAAVLLIVNIFIPIKYLSAYCVNSVRNEEGVMRVSFLDVDFGDCTIIELPDGKVMLIDGGDGAYSNNLTVLRALNRRGIDHIDYLICTSVKDEHCGGLSEIVRYKSIGIAFIPYCTNIRINEQYHAFIGALSSKSVKTVYACVGAGVDGGDYFFSFLSPSTHLSDSSEYAELNKNNSNENVDNASIVTWLGFGETSFLFTSDVRVTVLKKILAEYEASEITGTTFCGVGDNSVRLEDCDIVTLAGHGGGNNTYVPWLEKLAPKDTVISVGKNFAGLPSNAAITDAFRYTSRTPLMTRENGEIIITVTATGYTVDKEK